MSFFTRTQAIQKAFGKLDNISDAQTRNALQSIGKVYKDMGKEVKNYIAGIYEKFATSKGILTQVEMNKYHRFTTMIDNLNEAIRGYTGQLINIERYNIKEIMQSNYYSSGFITNNGYDLGLNMGLLSPETMAANIINPLDKITWIQREQAWGKKAVQDIQGIMNEAMIQGYGYNKPAKMISKKLKIKQWRSQRIVQTEMHRAQNLGRVTAFDEVHNNAKQLGIEMERIWVSQLLPNTRDSHSELDGQAADKEGVFHIWGLETRYPGGFGVAEQDINCHCTISEQIKPRDREYTRRLKNIDGKGYKDLTYKNMNDWKKIKADRMKNA